jgi:hypothetical protein
MKYCLLLCCLFATLPAQAQDLPVELEIIPYSITNPVCSGRFVTHTLDHTTTVPGGQNIHMFEANGAGVGINDLDNDGDLDLVLANHGGVNTILWNEGGLQFRTQPMSRGDARAVNILDLDGDGWLDLLFTRTATAPNYWRNTGYGALELELLPGVAQPLYTMSWADLDGDGDLDMAGATYDAGLLTDLGQDFLVSSVGGVYYYENDGGHLRPTRLIGEAQALALVLLDLNGDARLDILVGNDFAVPDYFWYRTEAGWEAAATFQTFSYSTMSYDYADLNNDGRVEVFATDMKPLAGESAHVWESVLESISGPQIAENTLQMLSSDQAFDNHAVEWGIDATGWSWSGKFGDFDHDGFLDLYVVNGMIEFTTFAELPDHELVEENQAFRNDHGRRFVPMPEWELNSTESGRGMSMGDLDNDGDLDIVVNNLRGPAQLFENQVCAGSSLQLDLRWPQSRNTRAIGATVTLHSSAGDYQRDVRVSSGYLSGDPARLHFGFPSDARLDQLEIRWPDGAISTIDTPPINTLLLVRR